jgi:hypothetical protein
MTAHGAKRTYANALTSAKCLPQAEVKRHAITYTTLNDIVQSVLDEISDYRHGAFKCIGDCRQLGNRSS